MNLTIKLLSYILRGWMTIIQKYRSSPHYMKQNQRYQQQFQFSPQLHKLNCFFYFNHLNSNSKTWWLSNLFDLKCPTSINIKFNVIPTIFHQNRFLKFWTAPVNFFMWCFSAMSNNSSAFSAFISVMRWFSFSCCKISFKRPEDNFFPGSSSKWWLKNDTNE